MIKVDGLNQKPTSVLLIKEKSSGIPVPSPGLDFLPHFQQKNLTKAMHYQETGYLLNQIKHIGLAGQLQAGMLLWQDTAFCKKLFLGLCVIWFLVLDPKQKQP